MSRSCSPSAGSTSPTRTSAVGCSNSGRRSLGACDGAVLDRAIAGISTKCSSGSRASTCICGVPSTAKARSSRRKTGWKSIRVVSKDAAPFHGGTSGSNPLCSTGESLSAVTFRLQGRLGQRRLLGSTASYLHRDGAGVDDLSELSISSIERPLVSQPKTIGIGHFPQHLR
jgi:hypothetical protein